MTTENWLTIVLIITSFIAQLIAPAVAVKYGESRKTQTTPSPRQKQPKNLIRKMLGWCKKFLLKPWVFFSLFIVYDFYRVVEYMNETEPLTATKVVMISTSVSLIFFNLITIAILTLSDLLSGIHKGHLRITEQSFELIVAMEKRIHAVELHQKLDASR